MNDLGSSATLHITSLHGGMWAGQQKKVGVDAIQNSLVIFLVLFDNASGKQADFSTC